MATKLEKETGRIELDLRPRTKTGELPNATPTAILVSLAKAALASMLFEAARSDHDDVSVVGARRGMRRIARAGHRVDRLLGDLGDLSDAEAGRLKLERKRIDLARLVLQVLDSLGSEARKLVRVEIRDHVLVAGDADRLERVVAILLDNALASAVDSEVVVRLDRKTELATLSISDHGPGLTVEQVAHVFDPRPPTATLPLYVAKKIIEAHNGRLAAESVPCRGSVFTIELVAAR